MTVESNRSTIGSGYGLYQSCVEYLMYMPADGTHTINLGPCGSDQSFTVELFEPLTGAASSGGIISGGTTQAFNPDGVNPMVVYLKSTKA
jgi:hypothetical protein